MNNRIVTPNGTTPFNPPSQKPESMADLLNSAHNDWKFKRKDEAFMKVLNALAMISTGTAQAMRAIEDMKAKSEPPKEDERPTDPSK
jgi:hypothetical protein